MNCGSSTRSWKLCRWVKLDLIFMTRDKCINFNLEPLRKFTSSRSTKFKDILPWNISQMISNTIPISTRIVIMYAVKLCTPFWVWRKVKWNWGNQMIRVFEWRKSHCRTITSVRKKQIQKSRTAWFIVRDLSMKVNCLGKVIWNRKIIT